MKINWFSPLPPRGTAIADYSLHVLSALSQKARVTVWTDQESWDSKVEQFGDVRRFHGCPDWSALNKAEATFYNIGNHTAFHGSLWNVSRFHAGIMILHDTHLQHFFAGIYKNVWDQPDAYCAAMARHYGLAGRDAAETYLRGATTLEELAPRFPLTPLAVETALGAVVHVPAAFEQLNREGRRPVSYIPLPYESGPAPFRTQGPPQSGTIAGPPYRLVVFGYLGPNRRLDSILEALAGFSQRASYHLHIYGHLDKPDRWQRRIARQGLSDIATIHGFVSEAELDEALAASHLALNLRYPSMGEASWSQLRLWNHGLPSLVTRTGWYQTISEEAVAFVRQEQEVADIRLHLASFLQDPPRFARMGAAGFRILRQDHAPDKYAESLIDFACRVQQYRGRANAFTLVERTGAILSQWASMEEQAPMLNRFAREIRRLAA